MIGADARWSEHLGEHTERLEATDAVGSDSEASAIEQVGSRGAGVERRWVHPHPLGRVTDHRFGERLDRGVVVVHAGAVRR